MRRPSITSKPNSTSFTTTIPSGTFASGETISGSTSAATTTVSSAQDLTTFSLRLTSYRRWLLGTAQISPLIDLVDQNFEYSDKTQTGRPNQFFLDRQITPVLKMACAR